MDPTKWHKKDVLSHYLEFELSDIYTVMGLGTS